MEYHLFSGRGSIRSCGSYEHMNTGSHRVVGLNINSSYFSRYQSFFLSLHNIDVSVITIPIWNLKKKKKLIFFVRYVTRKIYFFEMISIRTVSDIIQRMNIYTVFNNFICVDITWIQLYKSMNDQIFFFF